MRAKNPLTALADFMVEDIMAMSDEEILAEVSPDEIKAAMDIRDTVLDRMKSDLSAERAAISNVIVPPAPPETAH